jgi:AraC family transcriptional activator of pobA
MPTVPAAPVTPAAARRRAAAVPAFALYGEPGGPGPDLLHLETIASRSQRHRWEIDAHVHRGLHQLLWLECGSAQVALDSERQRCVGPAVIVIPPGVVHAFRFAPHTVGCVLTLSARAVVEGDAQAAGEALRLLFATPRVLPLAAAAEASNAAAGAEPTRVAELFTMLADECRQPDSAHSPVPLWLARALVWRLAERVQRAAKAAQPVRPAQREHQALFTRFVVLVETHHAAHWPVARYASRLGLTPERLNRLVRAEASRSALDLVHDRLAREACRRLIYVAAPISRLADELGFSDPAYFCRFFKRRLGCSPREYRRRAGQPEGQ